jgi:hypothetical protein
MRKPHDEMTRMCVHSELEYLGDNRDIRFLRCGDCGAVFLLHGGEAWRLPPAEPVTARNQSH